MIIAQSAAVSIGFVLDAIFGDPDFKLHPIRLIGYLILFLEMVMRRIFPKNERLGGAVMAICVLIICGGVPFAILFFAYRLNYFFGIAIESVICYFMLAAKSLKQAGMSVYKPLKNGDVDGARKSVSMYKVGVCEYISGGKRAPRRPDPDDDYSGVRNPAPVVASSDDDKRCAGGCCAKKRSEKNG